MSKTKLLVFSVCVLIGAFFGGIFGAGLAKADANSYLNMLEAAGYTGPVGAWMGTGNYICSAEARGQDISVIARVIYLNTGYTIGMDDAYEIISIANSEYCGGGGYAYAT